MHFSNQVFFGILAFFAKATGRLNSYFRLKVMSLKNYEKKNIINTVMGPSLGQSFVITTIKEEKKVKGNGRIFVTCNADKKKNH